MRNNRQKQSGLGKESAIFKSGVSNGGWVGERTLWLALLGKDPIKIFIVNPCKRPMTEGRILLWRGVSTNTVERDVAKKNGSQPLANLSQFSTGLAENVQLKKKLSNRSGRR